MNIAVKPKRILWRIFPAFLILAIIILAAMTWYSTYFFEKVALKSATDTLYQETALIETLIRTPLKANDFETIDRTLKQVAVSNTCRLTVILPEGTVIGDSMADVGTLENHKDRPEFVTALGLKRGTVERYSRTLKQRALYVAMPVVENGRAIAVVRASDSLVAVQQAARTFYIQILVACATILAAVSIGCYFLYHWLTTPLETLRDGIQRFSAGHLNYRLSVPPGDSEMSVITRAVNDMACQLDEKFQSLQNEQREKETILTSLFDGIMVIDCNESILNLNNVAETILGLTPGSASGQSLSGQVRNSALVDLVRRAIRDKEPATREIVFRNHDDEFYQVDCIPIRESSFAIRKIVVVFHNVTQTKRIQGARREVIMAVSEQLKSPASRIQELIQGNESNPIYTAISAESMLLTTILNDLIYLTQFEQAVETQKLEFSEVILEGLIEQVRTELAPLAAQNGISLTINGVATAWAHPPSLLYAFTHLITNAITYSTTNGKVAVCLSMGDDMATIVLEDSGIGIPAADIPHIFKPFYRINTPEHQLVRGGGLGLAIVKTIIDAHRGQISVTSRRGSGTLITIHIPTSGGSHVVSA